MNAVADALIRASEARLAELAGGMVAEAGRLRRLRAEANLPSSGAGKPGVIGAADDRACALVQAALGLEPVR